MTKYKVVCNQLDYAYKFSDKIKAIEAADRHKERTNHFPVHIYEVSDDNVMTRDELLAFQKPDSHAGIVKIESV